MMQGYEHVQSLQPFVLRRRVRWSDCDPAGVVYAGRFADYLLDACAQFFDAIGFGFGNGGTGERGFGLPAKHYALTFHVSLYPGDEVAMTVAVAAIRTRSFDLDVTARLDDGRVAFEGRCSPICIAADERRGIPLPQALRDALSLHLLAAPAAETPKGPTT